MKLLLSCLLVTMLSSMGSAGEIRSGDDLVQCVLRKVTLNEDISYDASPSRAHWQHMPSFEINGNGDGGYVMGTWLDEKYTSKRLVLVAGSNSESLINCKFDEKNSSGICIANSADSKPLTADTYINSVKGQDKTSGPLSIGYIKDSKIYCL